MKKLNQKAFAPVELLVVILVLIVVAFIGFTAYQRTNNSKTDKQADASGPKLMLANNGIQIFACRIGYWRDGVRVNASKVNKSGASHQIADVSAHRYRNTQGYRYLSSVYYGRTFPSTRDTVVKNWGRAHNLKWSHLLDLVNNQPVRDPVLLFSSQYKKNNIYYPKSLTKQFSRIQAC